MREKDRGGNLINIYCKHICKCHNASPVQVVYANKTNSYSEDQKENTNQQPTELPLLS
jgi:ribosomal protein L44E